LLNLVHPNMKAGYDDFALFELNKTHSKVFGMDEDVPKETDLLALTIRKKAGTVGYYDAKRLLDYIGEQLHLVFTYVPIDSEPGYDESAPYDHKRSAMVYADDIYIGIIGEYKTAVRKAFKLNGAVAGWELDPRALLQAAQATGNTYAPLSKYPSTDRDVCYKVSADVAYKTIYDSAASVASEGVRVASTPIDIYQADSAPTKNITLRFTITPLTKTLSSDEANGIVDAISKSVVAATGAEII